jgi:hypothetical protein
LRQPARIGAAEALVAQKRIVVIMDDAAALLEALDAFGE